MPEIFATRCGSIESSKQASMIAAVIEVMPATGAERRDRALVIAVRITEIVLGKFRVMEFRLGDIGHGPNVAMALSLGQSLPICRILRRSNRQCRAQEEPETALIQEFVQLRHQGQHAEDQDQEPGRARRPPRPFGGDDSGRGRRRTRRSRRCRFQPRARPAWNG